MSEWLPEQTSDDTDEGWGEQSPEEDPDDIERFMTELPPHHGAG